VLDVGSADGPSVSWMSGGHDRVALDVDPRGLVPGSGVCGSALALPFAQRTFDVVGAFDVLEHCAPEQRAVAELFRVLEPGGRLLASVPAYTWAWTEHDVRAGHHRRYTRTRLVRALELGGFDVLRATYGFAAVFPVFAAERLARRARERRGTAPPLRGLPQVSPGVDRLLTGVCRAEARVLRSRDLPLGSSVFVAARRPG
jgi:SAM-dependent methyltransferase